MDIRLASGYHPDCAILAKENQLGWSIHHPTGLIYRAPQRIYPGYTLISSNAGDQSVLIDVDGNVCHRWHYPPGISYARLLSNGNLLCRLPLNGVEEVVQGLGGSSSGLIELDWDGNVVWEYANPFVHHDFDRLENGNTLVLLFEEMSPEFSATVKGGYRREGDPERMLGDAIAEVAPDGSIVRQWRSWEHLDVEVDVICPLESRREWTHANSLQAGPDGTWLISLRRIDDIAIVDSGSGVFKWKWGRGVIAHQHDARFLPNGNVMIFNNNFHGVTGPGVSSVIEIDPDTEEIAWEYRGSPPVSFYSHYISGAERLPNGNTFICEGAHGRIFEVTQNKEIVWEYINPFFYPDRRGDGYSNAVFRAHKYGFDYPAFEGKDLSPKLFSKLNRLYGGM